MELKGCDKAHAFEQLLATMDYMKGNRERIYFPRIVVSKDAAPKIKSTAEKRMEKLVNTHKCVVSQGLIAKVFNVIHRDLKQKDLFIL